MERLMNMIKDYQAVNIEEKGISFAEEGFTQLYNTALEANWEHIDELKFTLGKGILIGSLSTGLVVLGVKSYNDIRKHKTSEVEKGKEVKKVKTGTTGNSEMYSFEVCVDLGNGEVDNVVVKAHNTIDAATRVMKTLSEGQEITDVNKI